jgi:hypothetical protein
LGFAALNVSVPDGPGRMSLDCRAMAEAIALPRYIPCEVLIQSLAGGLVLTEAAMNLVLSPPLLGFVVGTRVALAFGLGLLLSDRIPAARRRTIGLTLVALGAVTTIPAAMSVFGRRAPSQLPPGAGRSE